MVTTEQLQQYLYDHAKEMTDQWLKLREVENSVYSIHTSAQTTAELYEQNQSFIKKVTETLEATNIESYMDWARKVAEDRVKAQSPLYYSIKNFKKLRKVYLGYFYTFIEAKQKEEEIPVSDISNWSMKIMEAFDQIIASFTKFYNDMTTDQLKAQQAVISELSAPVIKLTDTIGVLPVVGEIDTYRAKLIQQKTLNKCNEFQLEYLILDLSGVPIIDTMVAQQLFQVIESVTLLGIQASITGIRPEIAQTAVQLGIKFGRVKTYAHMKQALSEYMEKST